MTLIRLPSVALDSVREDTIDATPGQVSSATGPYVLVDGTTFVVKFDGGSPQVVTWHDADFDDIGAARADEVVNVLNGALTGGFAEVSGFHFHLVTDTYGAAGSVQVTSGNVPFGLDTGTHFGTDAADQLVAINRIPDPGETDVDPAAAITFEVYRTGGAAPALADLDVDVGGSSAVVAGAAQPGWSVSSSTPDASTRRVILTPLSDLENDAEIEVVLSVSSFSFSASWLFRTIDDVSPQPLSALAVGRRVVRLEYTEPVRMASVSGELDALNPANYGIERVSKPAADVSIVEVLRVSDTAVDIILADDATFGATYRLYVTSVVDLSGNVVASPPLNATDFTGYEPAQPPGRRWRLRDWLPAGNFAEDQTGDLSAFVACLQEVANVLLADVDAWTGIFDPETAPPQFLGPLLTDLGNPFPSFDLSEAEQRRLAQSLVSLYQLRGSARGIVDAIRFFLGITVEIDPYNGSGWSLADTDHPDDGDELGSEDADGDPQALVGPNRRGIYSFAVVSPVDLTTDQVEMVERIVVAMKCAREHLAAVVGPTSIVEIDHVELGLSELGGTGPGSWVLH